MNLRRIVSTLSLGAAIAVAAGPACETTGSDEVACAVCPGVVPAQGSPCDEVGCSCAYLESCGSIAGTVEGQYTCVGDPTGAGAWRVERTADSCGGQVTSVDASASAAEASSTYTAYTASSASTADAISSTSIAAGGGGF